MTKKLVVIGKWIKINSTIFRGQRERHLTELIFKGSVELVKSVKVMVRERRSAYANVVWIMHKDYCLTSSAKRKYK